MESHPDNAHTIDAGGIPQKERKARIFEKFLSLEPGETLQVTAGHEPAHLLQHMEMEGLPVDIQSYHSVDNGDGTFTGFFLRTEARNEVSGKSTHGGDQ